ncbi:MAG TPA: HEAT repeat domain-containing protein, partial [Pseudomonadota bacterium]|nr:HEAT repeat domain-containing protein [Pseudomonadota bacterium]
AKLGEERGRVVLREAAGRKDQTQVLAARLLASVEASTNVELFLQILNNPRATAAALIAASEGLADAGQSDDARALAGLLGHADPRLRQTAASAIVELTGRDPAALSEQSLAWAEGALSDRSSEIRSSAVATLGESTTKTVPLLQKVLTGDTEPTVRRAAARALARRQERDALTALHLGLSDTDADVRKETLRAIERIGERLRRRGDTAVLAEVKSWLAPLLNGPSLEEQVLASGTLYQLGDELQRSRLAKWLTSADAAIRRLALEQLARDRELLAAVLVDLAPAVRLTAARKLAELGDRRGTDVLVEMMARGGLDGLSAYALLRKLGVPTLPPKDLNQLRFDANPRTRRAALDALSALPPGELRPLLLTAVRDRAPEVRLRGAELAAELPVDADNLPGGLPVLRTLLYDGDIVVRTRASALLSRLLRPIAEKEIAASTAARQQPRPPVAPQVPAGEPRPAGAPLNGGPNAGPNGGPDGGYPDGGYPDGGYPDGGYPDGGYPDGGYPDGGTPAGPATTVPIEATPLAETRLSALLVQQYLSGGVTALEHKDFAKAQKLLERAGSLCAKKGKRWKECAQLAPEITWRLGSGYEAQGQLANAAAEYQKLLPPVAKSKGKSERVKAAQAAIHRLSGRLGRIEISKPVDGRCEQAILWMEPGVHRVSLGNGQNKLVSVQAGQTTEVKTCTASAHGHHSAETP